MSDKAHIGDTKKSKCLLPISVLSINREWLCRRHQDRSRKTLSVKFPRCRCAASLTLKQKCVIYELFLRVKHGTQMFWQRQYNSFSPSVLSCVNVPLSNTWVKLEVCYDKLIKMGTILKLRCDHRYVLICMQRVKIEEKNHMIMFSPSELLKAPTSSIGSGKMIVEFFSAEIEFNVWRYLAINIIGGCMVLHSIKL